MQNLQTSSSTAQRKSLEIHFTAKRDQLSSIHALMSGVTTPLFSSEILGSSAEYDSTEFGGIVDSLYK